MRYQGREKTNVIKTIILSMIAVILLSSLANAATIDVGTSGYTYTTIGSGLAAANSGDRVHVHAGTYTISSSLLVPSGVTLYGDGYPNTIIKASSPTVMNSDANPALIYVNGKSNVEIYGFTLHGNGGSLAIMHDIDNDYRNNCAGIKIKSSSGTTIHDCYFTLTYGDSIRSGSGNSNTNIYNCQMLTPGHDGVNMYYGTNWTMHNCIVNTFINAGMRMEGVSGATVDHCTFYSDTGSGSGGVELLREVGTGILIDHNIFRNMNNANGVGIFTYQASSGTATASNNIFYDCPGGYITVSGMSFTDTGNQKGANPATDWVAAGYGYNSSGTTIGAVAAMPVYNGSTAPALISPSANATVTRVNGNVTFEWTGVNSTGYKIYVSEYPNLTSATISPTTTATSTTVALNASTLYYWNVILRNDVSGQWIYNSQNTRSFTTTAENAVITTGAYGIVYDTDEDNVIPGAVVTLMNDTWSATQVVGEDGYYRFSVLNNTGTYTIFAAATDYVASAYMPINMSSNYLEENIAMVKSPTYFAPHYVRFIVTDYTLSERYNATVSIYSEIGTNAIVSGNTGTEGSITFKLSEDIKYRVETIYGSDTQIDYITPRDSSYYIIVSGSTDTIIPSDFYDNVDINITKSEINSTNAYVNVSYNDSSVGTTSLMFVLGQYSPNGTYSPMLNSPTYDSSYITGQNGTINYSFVVSDYLGQSYTVRVDVIHSTYGTISKWFAVMFKGSNIPYQDSPILAYFAIFILFIVAFQFGRAEHATGAIIICGIFWFMYGIGLFDGFGEGTVSVMFSGGSLATIFSIASYINEKRKEDGD